jgi:dTDP-4-dehydrorhamnose reductase
MKVLITGCKGQLGLELTKQLSQNKKPIQVIATDVPDLDVSNQFEVFQCIETEKPDVIVNCAAYTNVDACEHDELTAFRVNAIGAQNLSAAA